MQTVLTACAIAAMALAMGCQKSPETAEETRTDEQAAPGPQAEKAPDEKKQEPGGTPVDYVDLVVKQPKKAAKKFNSLAMNQAVQAFQALEGRLPKSLDELKKSGFQIPPPPKDTEYKYDPKTGKVELVAK